MNTLLRKAYDSLPGGMRSFPASLRGLYLRWWRYGPGAEELVAAALERDSWSEAQWKTYQENRLGYVLHRAATQVPYYREQWSMRRRKGDRSSWEDLQNWSILRKETVREQPQAFVADDCDPRRMLLIHTSGTTGTPLDIWRSRITETTIYALSEARVRRWNAVTRHRNWAILGGQLVVPVTARRPPFWVWNAPMNELYLSANHISQQNARAFLDALHRYEVTHLIAYTSSVTFLAQVFHDQGLQLDGKLKVVLTNAEPVYSWQKDIINRGMSCPARETYGMGETVAAASERNGQLRLWPEMSVVEVLNDAEDAPVPRGVPGRLIGTGLVNADMPLIRYEVGDRITLATEDPSPDDSCRFPIIASIEGRINDLLITRDGRRVFWLNPVFYGLPVREAQIVQDSLDTVRVRYVPTPEFMPSTENVIIERLRSRLGEIKILTEPMVLIPRGPNNKFRPIVCNLPRSEISVVDPVGQ